MSEQETPFTDLADMLRIQADRLSRGNVFGLLMLEASTYIRALERYKSDNAALEAENAQLREDLAECVKLQAEVNRLRSAVASSNERAVRWEDKVHQYGRELAEYREYRALPSIGSSEVKLCGVQAENAKLRAVVEAALSLLTNSPWSVPSKELVDLQAALAALDNSPNNVE